MCITPCQEKNDGPLNFFPAEFKGLVLAQELLRFGIAGRQNFQRGASEVAPVLRVGHALDALDQVTGKREAFDHAIL
jgi:hypothetical protein